MISGIRAIPLNSWKEALEVKKQLVQDADKAKSESREPVFKTV